MRLFCKDCGASQDVPIGGYVNECKVCHGVAFTTIPRDRTQPKVPWALTTNDRRFLKSMRIAAEGVDG